MTAVLQAPREVVEAVAALRVPPRTDRKLQELMDRNNDGQLSGDELEDLESLVELSESIGIVRAKAIKILRDPS